MRLSAIPALVAATVLALPCLSQEQTAVTLKRTRKAGTITRYRINGTADVGGSEVTVERTMRYEVKEIKEDGSVVLVVTDQGGKINAMGQEMEVPLAGAVTITTDQLGRIKKYERSSDDLSVMSPEVEHLLAMAQDYVLPEKDVRPDDTWQYDLDNPVMKGKKATIKATYRGLEKVDDLTVWKVKQVLTAQVDPEGGKMEAEIVFFIDPADGSVVRAEGKVKNLASQYGPVDLSVKMTRLKAEEGSAPAK